MPMPTPSAPKPIRIATAIAVIPITIFIYVSSREESFKNSVRLARVVRLAQVHDGQHHEDVGLQSDHKDVENRPHEMQRQLIQADQSDEDEDELARIHVAE